MGDAFGIALALFADDLVRFVLGGRWLPAVGFLAAFGPTVGFGHVALNWQIFLRAVNITRPIFVGAVLDVVVFLGVAIPGMLAFGLAGFAATTFVQVLLRGYYMRRLFSGFAIFRRFARAAAPSVPPAMLILLARYAWDVERSLGLALAELAAYAIGIVALTWIFERALLAEALDYLRGAARPRRSAGSAASQQQPSEA